MVEKIQGEYAEKSHVVFGNKINELVDAVNVLNERHRVLDHAFVVHERRPSHYPNPPEPEIKPCPFCGEKAELVNTSWVKIVHNPFCPIGNYRNFPTSDLNNWNRRA